MILEKIEYKFKEIVNINNDLTIFPILVSEPLKIRDFEKNKFGEVFTPIHIIDHMIGISKPDPEKFNLDLCSGYGQFTIRILRYFHNNFSNFDIEKYLNKLHWFNELNIENAKKIIEIFGNKINIAIGPAQELKKYPINKNIWKKGIYYWDDNMKRWDAELKKPTKQVTLF